MRPVGDVVDSKWAVPHCPVDFDGEAGSDLTSTVLGGMAHYALAIRWLVLSDEGDSTGIIEYSESGM